MKTHSIQSKLIAVIRTINMIGVVSLFLMMVLISLDIGLRFFFNNPVLSPYAFETVELLMVVCVFCSLGWCELKKRNICVDVFVEKLSFKKQRAIKSVNYLISIAFCVLIAWRSFVQIAEIKKTNIGAIFLKIPIYPFQAVVAIGFFLLCVALLLNLLVSKE